jgi:hypothetical protein
LETRPTAWALVALACVAATSAAAQGEKLHCVRQGGPDLLQILGGAGQLAT